MNHPRKILILESDLKYAETLKRFAKKKGLVVDVAHSFRELREKWVEVQPDLLIANERSYDLRGFSNLLHMFENFPVLLVHGGTIEDELAVEEQVSTLAVNKKEGANEIIKKTERFILCN